MRSRHTRTYGTCKCPNAIVRWTDARDVIGFELRVLGVGPDMLVIAPRRGMRDRASRPDRCRSRSSCGAAPSHATQVRVRGLRAARGLRRRSVFVVLLLDLRARSCGRCSLAPYRAPPISRSIGASTLQRPGTVHAQIAGGNDPVGAAGCLRRSERQASSATAFPWMSERIATRTIPASLRGRVGTDRRRPFQTPTGRSLRRRSSRPATDPMLSRYAGSRRRDDRRRPARRPRTLRRARLRSRADCCTGTRSTISGAATTASVATTLNTLRKRGTSARSPVRRR